MKYRIVERAAFKVIGVNQEFLWNPEVAGIPGVPQFWSESQQNGLVDQLSGLNNGQIKGLLGITENFNSEKNTVDYWIATEHTGDIPTKLSGFVFPASKWVVFEVHGPIPSAMINAWTRIYSEWFLSSGYELAKIDPIEAYIDSNLESPDSVNEIWVAIK
jgi:AraC family transcriptional regulator